MQSFVIDSIHLYCFKRSLLFYRGSFDFFQQTLHRAFHIEYRTFLYVQMKSSLQNREVRWGKLRSTCSLLMFCISFRYLYRHSIYDNSWDMKRPHIAMGLFVRWTYFRILTLLGYLHTNLENDKIFNVLVSIEFIFLAVLVLKKDDECRNSRFYEEIGKMHALCYYHNTHMLTFV